MSFNNKKTKNRFRRKSQGSKSGDDAADEGDCDLYFFGHLGGKNIKNCFTQFPCSLEEPIKPIKVTLL